MGTNLSEGAGAAFGPPAKEIRDDVSDVVVG